MIVIPNPIGNPETNLEIWLDSPFRGNGKLSWGGELTANC